MSDELKPAQPEEDEANTWVKRFLQSEPLGLLFVEISSEAEKGEQNNHYHEAYQEKTDQLDNPEDATVKSYGGDHAWFLANKDKDGKAAKEKALMISGFIELDTWQGAHKPTSEVHLEFKCGENGVLQLVSNPKPKPVEGAQQFKIISFEAFFFEKDDQNLRRLYADMVHLYIPISVTFAEGESMFLLKRDHYPVCPRILCEGQRCLPVGEIDAEHQTKHMLFYCPRCNDFYRPSNPILRRTPGSFFAFRGPKEPYFFRVGKDIRHDKYCREMKSYKPKIFGLKMMKKETPKQSFEETQGRAPPAGGGDARGPPQQPPSQEPDAPKCTKTPPPS